MRSILIVTVVLAVVFVNGWTDAPNSIAAVVVSGALPFRQAAAPAALCEGGGLLLSCVLLAFLLTRLML